MTTDRPMHQAVRACLHAATGEMSAGDLAALRRIGPDAPVTTALYRVLATHVEPHHVLPESGPARDEVEAGWGGVLQALAAAGESACDASADRDKRLGVVLARAGLTELRLERLLRADDTLLDEVRTTVAFLVSHGEAVDLLSIADLILGHPEAAESIRRRIARDYFRTQHTLKES